QIQLKVNDRGPFVEGRIIDVSRRTAQLLGFENKGTAKVRVRALVPESLALNGIDKPQVMLAEKKPSSAFLESPLPSMNAALIPRLPDHLFEEAEEIPVLMKVSNKVVKAVEPSKSSRGLFIDIGAYGREEEANALLKTLGDLTKSNAQSIHASGPKPYVIRVGPFLSMAEANQILDRVLDAGHGMARIIIH
ncbi:MAG: SPOR domain-containing protein, partial [Alphaproteobacteria bacterium]|nr:SPOR domain-containing protein [Alphaproteobacteria bacterium]